MTFYRWHLIDEKKLGTDEHQTAYSSAFISAKWAKKSINFKVVQSQLADFVN